jgi:hypothetical protein
VSERKQYTIDYGGGYIGTVNATQAEYDEEIASLAAEKLARNSRNRYTMHEAAELLAAANNIGDAKNFLNGRMLPAVKSGLLRVADPKDGGPLNRRYRPNHDWVSPDNINKWLEGEGYPYRWPAPVQNTATPAPGVAASETPDPVRRLNRLRELGGTVKYKDGGWKFTGTTKLGQDEKGRARSDPKTIRKDLTEAAQAERDAKSAGLFDRMGA